MGPTVHTTEQGTCSEDGEDCRISQEVSVIHRFLTFIGCIVKGHRKRERRLPTRAQKKQRSTLLF